MILLLCRFQTIMKKRSFLSRGEEELDRIAKRVRLNDTINLAPANTKNFVFAHVTPPVKKVDDEENENIHVEDENESNDKTFRRRKRKASLSTTPKTTKRGKQERTDTKIKKTLWYIYVHMCIHHTSYIHSCTYTERERERDNVRVRFLWLLVVLVCNCVPHLKKL